MPVALSEIKNRISLVIKAKRRQKRLGVRAAAKECGIDPSTLSRLERGAYSTLPDAATLSKLCAWLGTSIDALLGPQDLNLASRPAKNTTPEIVEVHLRADKKLSPKTAEALAEMFRILYDQVSGKSPK